MQALRRTCASRSTLPNDCTWRDLSNQQALKMLHFLAEVLQGLAGAPTNSVTAHQRAFGVRARSSMSCTAGQRANCTRAECMRALARIIQRCRSVGAVSPLPSCDLPGGPWDRVEHVWRVTSLAMATITAEPATKKAKSDYAHTREVR